VERIRALFVDATLKGTKVPPVTVRFLGDEKAVLWLVLFTVAVRDAAGRVIELHTTLRDVTQQIKLRDQIIEFDTLSYITNVLAKVGGWFYDLQTGELFWSDEVRKIHEVDATFRENESSNRSFFSETDFQRLDDLAKQVIGSRRPAMIDLPSVTGTGKHKWLRIYLSVDTQEDVPTRMYGATLDITELMQKQHELERLVHELVMHQDRLEEFGDLASHQLRSPVANLKALSTLMRSPVGEQDSAELHQALYETIDILDRTVDEVSQAVKLRLSSVPKRLKVYVSDVVLSLKARMADTLREHRATINVDTSPLPYMIFPTQYLEVMLKQLISNAIQFAQDQKPPEVNIRTAVQDGWAMLIVEDNGKGLDLDTHGDRLFRFGGTFHRNGSRRGAGLFMIKTIVESLGGTCNVESKPNEGTTFRLALHEIDEIPVAAQMEAA
jgi:signal transduction histidine kinase